MRRFIRSQLGDKDIIEIYPDKIIKYQIRYDQKINENIITKGLDRINFEMLKSIGYEEEK